MSLTANISNWVARSAKLQHTCFVQHFVARRLNCKSCFHDKNWARNGNFSGANEKIELMSLPISPIFFPIDLHRGQPLAKIGPNNSIWQEIRGLFFACKLKKFFVFTDNIHLYLHRSFHFWVCLLSKFQVFLDKTVHRRSVVPQVACCSRQFGFFFILFVDYHEMFCALYILNFQHEQIFKKLGCGLENATSLPNDVIIASTA